LGAAWRLYLPQWNALFTIENRSLRSWARMRPGLPARGRWLDGFDPARPPVDLLRPFPAEQMRAWPVSSRVGNVRNNDSQLLEQF